MGERQDAMMQVRAELCDKLEMLRRLPKHSAREVSAAIAPIRTLASSYGFMTVARLAEALERAMVEQPARSWRFPTALYLDRLDDAIGCARFDDRTSETLLASVSVRLGA